MVSKVVYSKMNCSELLMERDAELLTLERLSGQQVDERSRDIALNLLILPGLGAVGSDNEELIAQSKGKMIVIQDQIDSRCIKDDTIEKDEESIQKKISHFFYDDPNSGVNKAIAALKKLYFGEDTEE